MNAIAEIVPFETGLAAYQPFRAELALFKEQNAALHFDYEDKKGNAAARSHVYKLRQSKVAVDKARLAETAGIRDLKARIDAEAKEIISEVEAMIDIHQSRLDEIEAKERERVDHIKRQIQHIVNCGRGFIGGEPQPFAILFRELEEKVIVDETFGEFELEAHKAKSEALILLKAAFTEHQQRESERAEIERLRREAAAREERDRKEREARELEEAAKLAAEERVKSEREAEARRAREAEETAKREAERERQMREEAERRAAEAVEQERQRVKRETEAKAGEDAKREANKRHQATVHGQIIKALAADGIDMTEELAKALITAIRQGAVPHVSINY